MMRDLMGQTFGRLTVIAPSPRRSSDRKAMWIVQCQCGIVREVNGRNLTTGNSKSCGCLDLELKTARMKTMMFVHGQAYNPLYRIWKAIHHRCYSPIDPAYVNYGGRGIYVEWVWHRDNPDGLSNFLNDVGTRPPDPEDWTGKRSYWTVDRTNNDGPYGPNNFRWATRSEQSRNQRPRKNRVPS